MKFKKAIALALSAMMVSTAIAIPVNASAAVTNKYEVEAAKLDKLAYSGNDLGATYTPEATTFKVWSPTASKVEVKLFATGSASESKAAGKTDVMGQYEMTYDETNGVWSVTLEGDYKNVYYAYLVSTGSAKPVQTGDIYAKAAGINGTRSMVVDLDSTDPKGWENDAYQLVANQTDANIWEIHVKDFSYSESSGVSENNRGKYLAFTEKGTTLNGEGKISTCVDYLKDMGIKYVHINPFYDFGSVQETGPQTQFNWGYDPKNYNVPEGSYSSNPYDGNVRINEVKQMVMALHDAGIGVIMDVVYNHTHEKSSFFNKTVPNYYYRIYNSGVWANNSGCGNDTASDHAMFRKFMIDSVMYWAQEYHIDGFRFDLMGLHDVETMNQIRSNLDTINPDLIMYGEGWNMTGSDKQYNYPPMANQTNAATLSSRISYFNDQFRDGVKGSVFEATGKGFLQEATKSNMGGVLNGIMANVKGGNWKAQTPEQTVSYVACHDNFTLYDRLVASMKGEVNEFYSNRYDDLVQMNKMAAALVYTSQGVPFILAGEEFARTKYGDHNSYKSSPEINKLDWNRLVDYADLVSYYKGMIKLRETYAPFRDATGDVVNNKMKVVSPGKLPNGVLVYTITDDTAIWKNVAVLFNSSDEEQTVTLPGTGLPQNWVILVDGESAGVNSLGEINTGAEITIPAKTSYVLADKASYEASGIKTETGKVVVKHVDTYTGEVLKQMTITDDYGKNYVTAVDSTLAIDYDLEATPANAEGKFSADTQTVQYNYIPYTLKAYSLKGNGDAASLIDSVQVQKHVSGFDVNFTEDQKKLADVNFDDELNAKDAILYQKVVLDMPVNGVGSVTTKYIDADTGEEISKSVVTRGRAGSEYTTTTPAIKLYVLDETMLPDNAQGLYSNGEKTVTYAYKLNAVKRFVHVKLLDGQTWVPNLYAWDTTGDYLGGWPGTAMADEDGDGWYDIQVNTTEGTYNWIINDGGGNQTVDNENADSDLWVVMKVAKPNKGPADSEYTVYTYNPDIAN